MLYNADLTVPDKVREHQLKNHVKAQLTNPFNAQKAREGKGKATAAEKEVPAWKPNALIAQLPAEGSAASFAKKKGSVSRADLQVS